MRTPKFARRFGKAIVGDILVTGGTLSFASAFALAAMGGPVVGTVLGLIVGAESAYIVGRGLRLTFEADRMYAPRSVRRQMKAAATPAPALVAVNSSVPVAETVPAADVPVLVQPAPPVM